MPRSALLASLPVLLHCTLLYSDPAVEQCHTDADCALELAGATGYCDVEHAICIRVEGSSLESSSLEGSSLGAQSEVAGCSADLTLNPSCGLGAAPEGETPTCPFASRECPCVTGAFDAPDALVIGTLSPHTYRVSTGDLLQIPYVARWLRSIELGLNEWSTQMPGGRLPRTDRPLAIVHCNSNDHLPTARRAMEHLMEVARAPVVVTLTDHDTDAVRYQALRGDTAVICATCLADPPPDPAETRLVWQIAPPLGVQATLYGWRVRELGGELRRERALPASAPLEVVVLSQDYPGVNELAALLSSSLPTDSELHVTSIQTSDPRALVSPQLEIARSVVSARPHVIAAVMDTDFTTYYLRMIEAEWPPGVARPAYVLTHMNQELQLFSDVVRDDDLRRRVSGTGFGLSPAAAQNLDALARRFSAAYSEPLENTQYGYDAFYSALYAMLSTEASRSVDGAELSVSLGRLSSGVRVDLGPAALQSSIGYIKAAEPLDLVGTSSELDWHPTAHRTTADVTVWCLSRDSRGTLALLADAGVRWHHDTGEISGQYACP